MPKEEQCGNYRRINADTQYVIHQEGDIFISNTLRIQIPCAKCTPKYYSNIFKTGIRPYSF